MPKDIIQHYVRTLSLEPGVYRMMDHQGEVLYVGKARQLKSRVNSYTRPEKLPHRLQRMVSLTQKMEFIITRSEAEALLLEAQLIKKFKPPFNVLLKDDKAFPFLLLTKDQLPSKLVKHRGKSKTQPGHYFGPFASTKAVNETADTLSRLFRLRTCSDSVFQNRSRPCLQYHLKRCSAPCVNFISQEDYDQSVEQAMAFLMGKTKDITHKLEEAMYEASQQQHYEKAALLRDRLQSLHVVQDQENIAAPALKSADFFALIQAHGKTCVAVFFYRHHTSYGNCTFFPVHDKDQPLDEMLTSFLAQFYEKREIPRHLFVNLRPKDQDILCQAFALLQEGPKTSLRVPQKGALKTLMEKAILNAEGALQRRALEHLSNQALLEGLQTLCHGPQPLGRIEIYDNSHLHGTNPYGVMVVAGPQGLMPQHYRKFKIQGESGAKGDDYGMMREVFQRRFKGGSTPIPDLILIDGGKGQLQAVQEALQGLDIAPTLVAIAKGPHRNAGGETLHFVGHTPQILGPDNPLSYYIQRLRDEAHRFAIGTHRSGRQKTMLKSQLLGIPGVGAKRKKLLLAHFGSLEALKRTTPHEIQKVPGISATLAQKILDHL